MPEDLAIRIENLSLRYRVSVEAKVTLKNAIMRAGRRERRRLRTIEAIKNLTIDIPHGSVVGVVGANGAGKSTLMRSIAGILPPTEGRIIVNGKVSTLLALGVGFNGTLSGRDNVILGGLAAGLDRDVLESKFEDIAAFADLPDGFIDMPMRTYSAGMYGRLAFSVAVNMTPDILLIDEALATGDAAFKEKSFDKMRQICDEARTIVIVSHALGTVNELCTSAMWLDKGHMRAFGEVHKVTEEYMDFLKIRKAASALEDF
ncbi:MAG TPA: ABC transporter ATP-binding protein [Candidatus Nanopelagicaceae bacterium]|nr:ABC transporter ATP-binding protein [Candidatus Nanopelagicaceae bacterium]